MKNFICYLNGVSSSGKTSIARSMLNKIEEKTIYLSFDDIHNNLCSFYSNSENRLYTEEVFGLHRTAKIWHDMGYNVIVDCVLVNNLFWEDAISNLPDSFFIGVFAPMNVVLKREKQKGVKNLSLIKEQFNLVHQKVDKYSLMVDSSQNRPGEIADHIIEKLELQNKKLKASLEPIRVKPDLKAAFNRVGA